MSGRIVYEDVAPGAAEDAAYSGALVDTDKSLLSGLSEGLANPNIATLELNRWLLNGTRDTYKTQVFGLFSSVVSGAGGVFATAPALTISFDQQFSGVGLSLRFGTDEVDYANHIRITWYQGDTVLSSKEFYPDANSYFFENEVAAFDKIVVEFLATAIPYRRARLENVMFGLVREFGPAELTKAELVQEVNLISAELAINTLAWSFRDVKGTDYMFQFKQPINAYNGDALLGVFYVNSASKVGEGSYDISCVDAVGLLDNEPFTGGVYSAKNAAELAQEITGDLFEVEVDENLSTLTVTGAIVPCTKREALQQVAFAIGAVVDTSGTHKILVKKVGETAKEIPENQLYNGGTVGVESIVTKVVVTWHSYAEDTSGSVEIGGTKYAETTGTVEVVNPNVTANTRANVVEVEGATLVSEDIAAEVAQRVYDYYAQRNLANARIVVTDEIPADMVTFTTAWGERFTGHIERMNVKISNTVAAETVARGLTN